MGSGPLLFITTVLPGTAFGAAQRSASLHQALRALGPTRILFLRMPWQPQPRTGECDHVIDAVAPGASVAWFYRRRHIGIGPFRSDPRLVEQLAAIARREPFRAILCRYALTLALDAPKFAPSAIDLDDVPTDLPLTRVPGALQPGRRFLMKRWLRDYRTVFVTKKSDVAKVPHGNVLVLPCISTSAHVIRERSDAPNLLFVGGGDHPPNAEGMKRFIARVWPGILERVPDATLTVAGWGWEHLPPARNLRVPGFIPSLDDAYRAASVVICPIWSGAGSCVKLAEAVSFGMPVVTTSFAAAGYGGILEPGRDLLASDSTEELRDLCVRLLGDKPLREQVSKAALAASVSFLSQASVDQSLAEGFGAG